MILKFLQSMFSRKVVSFDPVYLIIVFYDREGDVLVVLSLFSQSHANSKLFFKGIGLLLKSLYLISNPFVRHFDEILNDIIIDDGKCRKVHLWLISFDIWNDLLSKESSDPFKIGLFLCLVTTSSLLLFLYLNLVFHHIENFLVICWEYVFCRVRKNFVKIFIVSWNYFCFLNFFVFSIQFLQIFLWHIIWHKLTHTQESLHLAS